MPQLIPTSTSAPAVVPSPTVVPGTTTTWGTSPLFNYSTNQLLLSDSNDLILGNEAVSLSQRVIALLATPRLRYPIYTDFFGSDLHTLIGRNYPPEIIKSFAEKFIRAAVVDDRITALRSIDVSVVGKTVTVSFVIVAVSGYEKQFEAKWSV